MLGFMTEEHGDGGPPLVATSEEMRLQDRF